MHNARKEVREAAGGAALGRTARPSIWLQRQPDASTYLGHYLRRLGVPAGGTEAHRWAGARQNGGDGGHGSAGPDFPHAG